MQSDPIQNCIAPDCTQNDSIQNGFASNGMQFDPIQNYFAPDCTQNDSIQNCFTMDSMQSNLIQNCFASDCTQSDQIQNRFTLDCTQSDPNQNCLASDCTPNKAFPFCINRGGRECDLNQDGFKRESRLYEMNPKSGDSFSGVEGLPSARGRRATAD